MPRINLKKLNWTNKRLADGTVKTYWYAWRGGPLLKGQPGTPEFSASYHEAIATKKAAAGGKTLADLIRDYENGGHFNKVLSPRTRADYKKKLAEIEKKFGTMPL